MTPQQFFIFTFIICSSHFAFAEGDDADAGGRAGYNLPYETMYADDRQQHALTDRSVYVFGEDHLCYKAKFDAIGDDKALTFLSTKAVSADHCIYQKKMSEDISGFSIFAEDGGICQPAYSEVPLNEFVADPADKLQVVRHRVSFRYCFEKTVSVGDVLEKKPGYGKKTVAIEIKPKLQPKAEPDAEIVIEPATENLKVEEKQIAEPKRQIKAPVTVAKNDKMAKRAPASVSAPKPANGAAEKTFLLEKVTDSITTSFNEGIDGSEILKHKYAIQLASFGSSDEAKESIAGFDSKGLKAFDMIQIHDGKPRHRVCVGTFDNMPSAKASLKDLREKGITQGFVQMIHLRADQK